MEGNQKKWRSGWVLAAVAKSFRELSETNALVKFSWKQMAKLNKWQECRQRRTLFNCWLYCVVLLNNASSVLTFFLCWIEPFVSAEFTFLFPFSFFIVKYWPSDLAKNTRQLGLTSRSYSEVMIRVGYWEPSGTRQHGRFYPDRILVTQQSS